MKTKLLLAIFSLFVLACSTDDVKELTRITQDFTLSQSIDVSIPEGPITEFSATKVFDATDDVKGFDSKLDNLSITGLTMDFSNYSSSVDPVTITDASLTFEGTGITLAISDDIDLSTISSITLTIPDNALSTIETSFLADKKLTVAVAATVDKVPVDFTITVNFDVEVTGTLL